MYLMLSDVQIIAIIVFICVIGFYLWKGKIIGYKEAAIAVGGLLLILISFRKRDLLSDNGKKNKRIEEEYKKREKNIQSNLKREDAKLISKMNVIKEQRRILVKESKQNKVALKVKKEKLRKEKTFDEVNKSIEDAFDL